MKHIAVLGSTGSIGRQTLQIAEACPEELRVVGIACNKHVETLLDQASRVRPKYMAVADEAVAQQWNLPGGIQAMVDMVTASEVDMVVVAIVGASGLLPTLAALQAGKKVALANKETLVMAGSVIRGALKHDAQLIPIDSEHSAIWQCLQGEPDISVEKMLLTASGGAFRDWPAAELSGVTPKEALQHPTWDMGPKVTIDCATLMNKGLEVIEATLLFDLPIDKVDVVMHRESIVHSLVYFSDSSVKAQLGLPDMRLPIQYALSWPDRWNNQLPRLDLTEIARLHFAAPDFDRYPCLKLALEAGRLGGTYPAALCAADEVAVDLFVDGKLSFGAIPELVHSVMDCHVSQGDPNVDEILRTDAWARQSALEYAAGTRV